MSDDIFDFIGNSEPQEEPGSAFDRAHWLQNGLVSAATGGVFEGGDAVFKKLRGEIVSRSELRKFAPDFLIRCRDLGQFWQFIKHKFDTYAERRKYLYDAFTPLLSHLELADVTPTDASTLDALQDFHLSDVHEIWQRALSRKSEDPAGAITLARTLLESVCKYVLDEEGVPYDQNADLPKLWYATADLLNLAPSQHSQEAFRAILGNTQSIVNNIATLRNRLSDSHGQGRAPIKPKPRHAEFVVNLAGTMASFVAATWRERKENDF